MLPAKYLIDVQTDSQYGACLYGIVPGETYHWHTPLYNFRCDLNIIETFSLGRGLLNLIIKEWSLDLLDTKTGEFLFTTKEN